MMIMRVEGGGPRDAALERALAEIERIGRQLADEWAQVEELRRRIRELEKGQR
jgi:hypothetical protein